MNDSLIRWLLLGMFALFFVVRAYHHRKAVTEGGAIEYREPHQRAMQLMRQSVGLAWLAAMGCYFFIPRWVAWADFPMPEWIRWVGLALGYANLPLLWWIEATLGKNFNTTLHVREGHTLVTNGPYRWVRHPMYTSLYILVIAIFLASANWLVGLPGLLSLTLIIFNRLDREEALMLEQFGDAYRAYMQRTGRLFPRLSRS